MEQVQGDGDVYAAGRSMSFGPAPEGEEPEGAPGEDDGCEDDGEEAASVHRTASRGPVVVQQNVTAGRNAFAVSGDAVIHVRNHD